MFVARLTFNNIFFEMLFCVFCGPNTLITFNKLYEFQNSEVKLHLTAILLQFGFVSITPGQSALNTFVYLFFICLFEAVRHSF